MKIETYQLKLVPDHLIPEFKRLQFKRLDIPLADVFQYGIHPYSITMSNNSRDHTSITDAIMTKLNSDEAYVTDLKAHDIGHEVSTYGSCYESQNNVEKLLQLVSQGIYFVDDLSYEQLTEIATARLRKIWNHTIARDMVRAVGRDFAGIRDFLKRKKPDIKLIRYESLDEYDLSLVVSVDDFLTEDSLLVEHGIESRNFRKAGAIQSFTDNKGLLKLAPFIKQCVIEWDHSSGNWHSCLKYSCIVEGTQVQWYPTIKPNPDQRGKARQIAKTIGEDTGKYCFRSSLQDMEKALEDEHFHLRFPDLNYKEKADLSDANAEIKGKSIVCYGEIIRLCASNSNERLKEVLRCFGKKVTGKKEELVNRVAELLAEQYHANEKEMHQYFFRHRFVKLKAQPKEMKCFPLLKEHKLRNTLLVMYCLRHMRGNVILEASHVNESVKLPDLAQALLEKRVELSGSFVRVA